jgi:hypothetical protein
MDEEHPDPHAGEKLYRTRTTRLHCSVGTPARNRIEVEDVRVTQDEKTGEELDRRRTVEKLTPYTWRDLSIDRDSKPYWTAPKYMLDEFVNRVRGRPGSGAWVTTADSMVLATMVERAYHNYLRMANPGGVNYPSPRRPDPPNLAETIEKIASDLSALPQRAYKSVGNGQQGGLQSRSTPWSRKQVPSANGGMTVGIHYGRIHYLNARACTVPSAQAHVGQESDQSQASVAGPSTSSSETVRPSAPDPSPGTPATGLPAPAGISRSARLSAFGVPGGWPGPSSEVDTPAASDASVHVTPTLDAGPSSDTITPKPAGPSADTGPFATTGQSTDTGPSQSTAPSLPTFAAPHPSVEASWRAYLDITPVDPPAPADPPSPVGSSSSDSNYEVAPTSPLRPPPPGVLPPPAGPSPSPPASQTPAVDPSTPAGPRSRDDPTPYSQSRKGVRSPRAKRSQTSLRPISEARGAEEESEEGSSSDQGQALDKGKAVDRSLNKRRVSGLDYWGQYGGLEKEKGKSSTQAAAREPPSGQGSGSGQGSSSGQGETTSG